MTTTTTRRTPVRSAAVPAAGPAIYRLNDGRVILTGLPFMIDGVGVNGATGRASRLMNSRGLGWKFEDLGNGTKGWVSGEPGAAREAVATLADYGVVVADLSGTGAAPVAPAPKASAKAAPKASAKAAPKGARSASITSIGGASGAAGGLAAAIAGALAAEGVDASIIAAAVAAATAKADEIAKAATATVSTPAPKVARAKAAGKGKASAPVVAAEGERVLTLTPGVPVAAAAKAVRQRLSRSGVVGVSVRKDGRNLVAYREDGAEVSADIDAIMIAAVAAVG